MRGDIDEGLAPTEQPAYPGLLRIAGMIWIIFGCLILLNAGASLLLNAAQAREDGGQAPSGMCGLLIPILFGAVFIHVGLQSTRGTAADTLGNGIGSIVLALLVGGVGALAVVAGLAVGGEKAVVLLVSGAINMLAAVGLLAAGVLALVARQDYKAWRRANKVR